MNKIKYEAMDSNRPQRPQLGIGAVSVSFDSLIEQLKEIGYSVFIKNSGNKKVIMWSTKTHFASVSFTENSEDDLKRVYQRLKETIYNVSFTLA